MARARNIKPSIMDNDALAALDGLTRLLFVYMWMLADREGRLEDNPARIGVKALSYDRDANVDDMLWSLHKAGFIQRYEVDGAKFIQVTTFSKHQSPHVREAASELPDASLGKARTDARHNLGEAEASPRSPDCGLLIPDCGLSAMSPPAKQPKPAKSQKPKPGSVGVEVLVTAGFDQRTAEEFIAYKLAKKAPLTPRAWTDHLREAEKVRWSPMAAAEKVMARGWSGFESRYVANEMPPRGQQSFPLTIGTPDDHSTQEYLRQQRDHKEQAANSKGAALAAVEALKAIRRVA